PISEALVPAARRPVPPRLIVTVVWDGGGWNVLDRWPGSWPFLREIMGRGTSVEGAIVGSSPSVTPAIHTNIGTGALPDQHGIADIPIRAEGTVADSFRDTSGELMKVPTLADLYDPWTGNKAKIALLATKSWHLGLLGRGSAWRPGELAGSPTEGASTPGDLGDKDIAVIAEAPGEGMFTNPDLYRMPDYLREVPGLSEDVHTTDIGDGLLDSAWMGHEILGDPSLLHFTPAWVLYQTRLLEALVDREELGSDEVPDLLFTNYKSIDEVGHRYNMVNPEMEAIVGYSDRGLEELTGWLDDEVGRGRWVLAFTADHGQAPAAEVVGAWPIHIVTLVDGLADRFGVDPDDLIEAQRPTGLWLNRALLAANGITLEAMADWLTAYTLEANIPEGTTPPEEYGSRMQEKIFEAVFPARWLPDIMKCASGGGG
ncbi:MAG: alkaline phosphatase family protein, partial [Actinomycetota bacterium]|nr:alkaline phosphatase family protein [Actinomycetota bacterium]